MADFIEYIQLGVGSEAVPIRDPNAAPAIHTHTKSQITDFPSSMPASDVYEWAKAESKPIYTASEVGAAPSGFGLGGIGTPVTNWNDAKANGWYSANGDAANAPFPNFASWGYVAAYAETDAIIQTAYTYTSDDWAQDGLFEKKRIYKSSVGWLEWEWVNPPMAAGKEYRTTERFNGKPVYAYFLNYGYYSTSTTSIPHGISGMFTPISIDIMNNEQEILTNSSGMKTLTFDRTNIGISCNWNMGNVFFLMKYTK